MFICPQVKHEGEAVGEMKMIGDGMVFSPPSDGFCLHY